MRDFLGKVKIDCAIGVCDPIEADCPRIFPFALNILQWPFEDPAAAPARVLSAVLASSLLSDVVAFAEPQRIADRYARPGFHTEVQDGRLWVFRDGSEELEAFKKDGELTKSVSRIGAGPDGMTIKAPDAATIDAYLSEGQH